MMNGVQGEILWHGALEYIAVGSFVLNAFVKSRDKIRRKDAHPKATVGEGGIGVRLQGEDENRVAGFEDIFFVVDNSFGRSADLFGVFEGTLKVQGELDIRHIMCGEQEFADRVLRFKKQDGILQKTNFVLYYTTNHLVCQFSLC